jgi:hypothetical protein
MRRFSSILGAAFVVLIAPRLSLAQSNAGASAFFENQVRPLLAKSCFKCHSSTKQEAGLRLDSREALLKGGESGPAVVVGQPDKSLLLQAVRHQGDIKMPKGGKLKEDQIAVLARWVKMGAPWPQEMRVGGLRSGPPTAAERRFWSFQPIKNPPAPPVKDTAWPKNEVDRFILAQLEMRGIQPAKPADKRTLLRRATFDLTGLPPTPEEIGAFLKDDAPDAFTRVVDRLLASPHYGERWGRHWLDVVRYADTCGETADYPVPEAYRYRNYVIDAFNKDKPYDEFVREQIAGDILASQGPRGRCAERIIATGFIAQSRRFGYDTEAYEHLTIQDTIDTLGQAFLGLSLGCARCHDHKFDPVAMPDYYALYGIFASTRYAFPGSERLRQVRALVPLVPPDEAGPKWEQFLRQLAGAEATPKDRPPKEKLTLRPLTDLDGDFELQTPPEGGSRGFPSSPWQHRGGTNVTTAAQSPYTNLYPAGVNGINFPADLDSSLGQGFAPSLRNGPAYFNLDFRNADTKDAKGTYRIYLGHGADKSPAIEAFIGVDKVFVRNGKSIEAICDLKPGVWYNLQLALDLDAKTYSGTVGVHGDVSTFTAKAFAPSWDGRIDYLAVDGRGHLPGVKPAHDIDNIGLRTAPIPSLDPASDGVHPRPSDAQAGINPAARPNLSAMIENGPVPQAYAVVEGTPHDARIHKRGEPDRPGPVVPRRFLEILGGDQLPADAEGSGRLQLAQWLTRKDNPLIARVMVNRIWQHHFGTGLVATPNDFGTRGSRPTHPELLDWLASRFIESGWSIKAMHRLIMLSRTYQQLSAIPDCGLRIADSSNPQSAIRNPQSTDPGNNLLSHFSRHRLDAESIRDSMLLLGGNLDRSMGGRHPFPPVQECKFTQHAPFNAVYPTNRRSVYLMTQRIKRHPFLALFDGADTNASTATRVSTTVPTQALFLMNDPFVHEQAATFARRLLAARADDASRMELAFVMALTRPPSTEETREALDFLTRYRRQSEVARIPAEQHDAQAWAAFAWTLLARNEFLFVD